MSSLVPDSPAAKNGFYDWFLRPLFRRVQLSEASIQRLRDANERGRVVYTFRSKRSIDPRYLTATLERLGLAEPQWLHDHRDSSRPSDTESLVEAIGRDQSALLFLRRPRTLTTKAKYSEHHVEALLELQKASDTPILLIPVGLQWTKKPVGLRRSMFDAVFGDREAPGVYREFFGFLWRHGEAKFHVGAPVDLQDVLLRYPKAPGRTIAKKVRWTILHHLGREDALRVGPINRSAQRTRQAVKRDPKVRQLITTLSQQGKSPEQLEKEMDSILKRVAADMRYGWIWMLDRVIDFIWHRIYDGIQVDQDGLERVRTAARRGPVVVVPSHKSHIDYLVLSQVFFRNDLIPPHIAAGENLNFWPVGLIFRRGGAFFIRRSFRGDKLYTAVFSAYVRRLLKEGHVVEFFIEGGRSRTGKLLAPKMGMLSMCAEPGLDGALSDVSFVPISVSYEKVIEAGSYAKELAGGRKKKENVRSLVSSAKVLRSKYGRVYVDFDEPISLRAFAQERQIELPLRLDQPAIKKRVVQQLGYQIVYGINRVTRVTTTSVAALVLLAQTRLGMGADELIQRTRTVLERLEGLGARLSSTLSGDEATQAAALGETLERFVNDKLLSSEAAPDGTVVYQLSGTSRVALDFYRNNVLHFFLPTAVVSTAVLASQEPHLDDVRSWAQVISQMLKGEVTFQMRPSGQDATGTSFELNFADATRLLDSWGVIRVQESSIEVKQPESLKELANYLGVFFEAYGLLGETFEALGKTGTVSEKKLLDESLSSARRRALDGRLQRAEAASQPVLRQALSMFLSESAIVRGEQGTLLLGEDNQFEALMVTLGKLNRVL